MKKRPFVSGFAAIIGRPNVGKSTILNYLLGVDLSIVTARPETTRNRILGTLTTDNGQINFLDTPGMHIPHTLLGKYMVRQAQAALQEADLALAVIDARTPLNREDLTLLDAVKESKKPALLLINKSDIADKRLILPLIEECSNMGIFKEFIPISAKKGDNMDLLLRKIFEFLKPGPKFYPEDYLTDKPQRFFAAEFIRQQALELTREEIPHSVAVMVEEMKKKPKTGATYIQATIFVERPSQKAIIIGKAGQMLKTIGQAARARIEKHLGAKVFLNLWVKVYKDWRYDPAALKMLGYA